MIDIVRLFSDHRIPTIQRADFVNVLCPYCRQVRDPKPGLGFHVSGQACTCWKCGKHSVTDALQRVLSITYPQLQKILPDYEIETAIRRQLNKKQPQARSITLPGLPLNKVERRYLEGRGFDPDFLVSKYGIQGGGVAGDYAYRIIIPVTVRGQVVAFTTRDITGKAKRKYISSEIEKSVVNLKTLVYNIDNAFKKCCCVLEGVFDVWRMGDGFVAGLGTSLIEPQIRLLTRFDRVVFMFDPEIEAQARARKYAEQLAALGGRDIEVVNPETVGDPGSWTPEQAEKIKKELGL